MNSVRFSLLVEPRDCTKTSDHKTRFCFVTTAKPLPCTHVPIPSTACNAACRRRPHQGHHCVTPPEHLIRFFPFRPLLSSISRTRQNIHNIMVGKDDRLLVIGPCSIHDPAAACWTTCAPTQGAARGTPTQRTGWCTSRSPAPRFIGRALIKQPLLLNDLPH
jgi:hypothetical protein